MFLDSHNTVFIFRSSFDLLDFVLACLISSLKIFKHFKTTYTGLQISQASEKFGKFCRPYSELLSKFGAISFREYVFNTRSSTTILYCLQTKEGQKAMRISYRRAPK